MPIKIKEKQVTKRRYQSADAGRLPQKHNMADHIISAFRTLEREGRHSKFCAQMHFKPSNTKRRLFYLKTQFVPRS